MLVDGAMYLCITYRFLFLSLKLSILALHHREIWRVAKLSIVIRSLAQTFQAAVAIH